MRCGFPSGTASVNIVHHPANDKYFAIQSRVDVLPFREENQITDAMHFHCFELLELPEFESHQKPFMSQAETAIGSSDSAIAEEHIILSLLS
jgi:hypothetical protein